MEVIGEWEGLPINRALDILRKSGVTVSVEGDFIILAKSGIQRTFKLPPRIKRRMLRTFCRLFDVEFHSFFI